MKPISCGFLIHYTPDDTYFICHATQMYNGVDDEMWTIPKGIPDVNEPIFTCALRELHEETGLILDLVSEPPCIEYDTPKKTLYIFLYNTSDESIKHFPCRCDSLIDNPHAPHMNGLPECDAFGWFTKHECHARVFKSLKPLFSIV
jgi:8-oxo-dGTP pyrophosphatase MutT (NUDIX family)